ncbi:MAG: CDP-diacylglycerol--glycerol-3-phosphate 3-phosphatidyltransferase [Nitrospinae bacterium]|nr:CDP-diacylglycerol--glycerol-3-phosphate 3-phosphatidyltransferase [Nitrospinota bacterium]
MHRLNLPNKITIIRIFLIPLFLVFLISSAKISPLFAASIFGVAAFTDWLDGYLARTTKQVTTLGKLLDPIADKILVTAALIPLVELDRISAWIAVVIIGREFAVSGLRTVAMSQGIVIAASWWGKYKMVFEIIAIMFLILNYKILFVNFLLLGTIAIWVAMVMSLVSGIDYFIKFWNQFNIKLSQ